VELLHKLEEISAFKHCLGLGVVEIVVDGGEAGEILQGLIGMALLHVAEAAM